MGVYSLYQKKACSDDFKENPDIVFTSDANCVKLGPLLEDGQLIMGFFGANVPVFRVSVEVTAKVDVPFHYSEEE